MTEIVKKKNVPLLRFKGFDGEWKNEELGNVSIFLDSKRVPLSQTERSKRQGEYPYYGASGIIDYIDEYIFDGEYVLLGEDGANIINRSTPLAFVVKGKMWINNHAHVLQAKESNHFLAEALERIRYDKYNTGTAQPKLNATVCKQIKFFVPQKEEQTKIANFLTAIDTKIGLLQRKKTALENYKKGVMQQIFKQEIRFVNEDGKAFPDWEKKKLSDFLIPTLRVIKKPNELYLSIGIRSHCKGTFQKANTDPKKNAMDKLYKVSENDLIVNITFAWEGAIAMVKKEDEGGLVSHRFPTYTFNRKMAIHEFFQFVFVQKKFRHTLDLISPGGAGRNRVMSKKEFLKIEWNIPSVQEQIKISNFLIAINKKISQLNEQLDKVKTHKKGLLQQLFV